MNALSRQGKQMMAFQRSSAARQAFVLPVQSGRHAALASVAFIGDAAGLFDARRLLGSCPPDRAYHIHELDGHMRGSYRPEMVVCLAIGALFDCLDVARVLGFHEFDGRFRVIASGLPRPRMIRDELRRIHPALDTDLLSHWAVRQPSQ